PRLSLRFVTGDCSRHRTFCFCGCLPSRPQKQLVGKPDQSGRQGQNDQNQGKIDIHSGALVIYPLSVRQGTLPEAPRRYPTASCAFCLLSVSATASSYG